MSNMLEKDEDENFDFALVKFLLLFDTSSGIFNIG